MTAPPEGCTDLSFDAKFFGAPVWRLDDPERAPAAVRSAARTGVALIVARTESDDRRLRETGFRSVETLLTLQAPLSEGADPVSVPEATIRPATGRVDADACAAIAARAFQTDRFHADPAVPNIVADRLKAEWARNNAMERADFVFIAETDRGEPIGFNSLLLRDEIPVIDLIAVSSNGRGKGIGNALVRAAMAHYAGFGTMRVGTQITNTPSLALYSGLGFVETARQTTWHWTPIEET